MTDWQPTADRAALWQRAELLQRTREFFNARGVMEVTTPVMGAATVTDPNINGIAVDYADPRSEARRWWLQTSPEYPMKRLLAAGSGPIYQIAPVFRHGERGHYHNPEFSLLEWYRPGFGYRELIGEVAELLNAVLAPRATQTIRYADAFSSILGVDPLTATDEQLQSLVATNGLGITGADLDRDACLDLLMGALIAPRLGQGSWLFVTHFPVSQAALARLDPEDPRTAERFECFIDGVEVANGFRELTDPQAQRARFEADQAARRQRGETDPPAVDERLIAALESGMPECSGVALGLDRLLMVALGAESIDRVMAFPLERA